MVDNEKIVKNPQENKYCPKCGKKIIQKETKCPKCLALKNDAELEAKITELKEQIKEIEHDIKKSREHLAAKPYDVERKINVVFYLLYYITLLEDLEEKIKVGMHLSVQVWAENIFSIRSKILMENSTKVNEIMSLCNQAIKQDKECVDAWSFKSDLLRLLGRYNESADCVNEALRLNPYDDMANGRKKILDYEYKELISEGVLRDDFKKKSFDEVVEKSKTIKTQNSLLVQSTGEKLIADFLDKHKLGYDYDKQMTFEGKGNNKYGNTKSWARPDFYLIEFNIVIEYWGLKGTPDYDEKMEDKKRLYKEANQKFISIFPEDLKDIGNILTIKLKRMGVNI